MADLAVVANVVLWACALALAVLVLALTRQVRSLHGRIAPAGALSVNQTLKVGMRAPSFNMETLGGGEVAIAAPGATAWNPVFDVTPAGLVDYLVTEAGVVAAPDRGKLAALPVSQTAPQ